MIYNPDTEFTSEDYIHTPNGNIVSRSAAIYKPQAVEISFGKCIICADVIIRGDLAPVKINSFCFFGARTVLHPSYTCSVPLKFIPMTIGSYSCFGENCVIESAIIGIGCEIEKNCILSKRCILKDFVKVLEGSVLPPGMVVPPFSIVAGNPAQIVAEQHESTSTISQIIAVERYKAFKPKLNRKD